MDIKRENSLGESQGFFYFLKIHSLKQKKTWTVHAISLVLKLYSLTKEISEEVF